MIWVGEGRVDQKAKNQRKERDGYGGKRIMESFFPKNNQTTFQRKNRADVEIVRRFGEICGVFAELGKPSNYGPSILYESRINKAV